MNKQNELCSESENKQSALELGGACGEPYGALRNPASTHGIHYPPTAEGMAALANHAEKKTSPLAVQVGGDHYRNLAIQPVEFIHVNGLSFLEGCVIKRVCRHRNKAGAEDIRKAIHELQLIMKLEYPDDV